MLKLDLVAVNAMAVSSILNMHNVFTLNSCHSGFSSLNRMTLDQHPHNAYISYMGPRAREAAVHTAYRSCQRKRFREDQPQVTLECARCKLGRLYSPLIYLGQLLIVDSEFPDHTMRTCAGPCDGTFCDQCFPHASINHIHGPSNFRSVSDEARPEIGFLPAGWRALKNTEGRIYYLEDQTKKFTFAKPQVPNTLPAGWTSMLDSHGKPYYLDHNTRSATYVSPVYGIAPIGYELRQTNTGRLYYVNRKTQAATWHKPLPMNEKLPAGWEAGQHADGRVYYINHLAKKTQWTRPTSPATTPAHPTQPPKYTASASHQAIPVRPTAGHTPASAGLVPTRPTEQVNRPTHPAPHNVQPAAHPTNSTATGVGHTTAGPRPGHPVHRPATTASVGPAAGIQHAAPGTHVGAPVQRPSMPHKVASAPAATNNTNIRSSLNALAHNPKAQKVALGLGLSVFKAAVTPDYLANTDISNVGFGGIDLGTTNLGDTDVSSTDAGTSFGDMSGAQTQDSSLGASFEPTVVQSSEILDVQNSDTESYSVATDSQLTETSTSWAADTSQTQYTYITDTPSPTSMSTTTISPPLMSPTGWTDPTGSGASYMPNQPQAGYATIPYMGNENVAQNNNPVLRNPQYQNPAMHNAQRHKPATHNAHQNNNAIPNSQRPHPAMQNAQQSGNNRVMQNVQQSGNNPAGCQNPSSYSQQNYLVMNDQSTVVCATDETDTESYSVTETETIDVTDNYDPSLVTETTYVDTTTYTVQDDGSTDTVDYSFVSSQDLSSDC